MGFIDLLLDNTSVVGRLVTSAIMLVVAIGLAAVLGRWAPRGSADPYHRYYLRKAVRYAVLVVLLIALAVVWRPFAGRVGVVLGLFAAGVAFAMQEVIGALAGWISIMSGKHFRVGDRIQMAGVLGDVLDITPLRTKLLEIESDRPGRRPSPSARQYTGRVVSVSNKAIFTEPVYNSTADLEYLWDELTVPIRHGDDWRRAERILREEAESASASQAAQQAIQEMRRRYPVARTEVEPRVFIRVTDNWVELAARFVVPVRQSRAVRDQVSRRVLDRLAAEGIAIASVTEEITVREFPEREA